MSAERRGMVPGPDQPMPNGPLRVPRAKSNGCSCATLSALSHSCPMEQKTGVMLVGLKGGGTMPLQASSAFRSGRSDHAFSGVAAGCMS